MQRDFIPVAAPVLAGNEKAYVNDCLDEGWISSSGKYIGRFEEAFADFCGVPHAVGCCNGTVALHIALLACGIGPGDEVIVPALTFVATANAVRYCGATPIFADSETTTWNLDPADVAAKVTARTKALIVVHLYGHPAAMDDLRAISRRHGLRLIEDAAEAHGAEFRGKRVGGLGDVATFSFYGNKIITTGEGGMVVTRDPAVAEKLRLLRGQGMDPQRRYWFPIIGYNYRLTNIAAAIGLAQVEKTDWHLARRRDVAGWYLEHLAGIEGLRWQNEAPWARHVYWMFTVLLDRRHDRDEVMRQLAAAGIETRPIFFPMHLLPPYEGSAAIGSLPCAEDLAARGINLPTWAGLREEDVVRVCGELRRILREPEST